MEIIEFKPTDGLCYDPNDSLYWDKSALRKEINRSFELCHSCRMCFKYCDAFPLLFDLIDKQGKKVSDLTEDDIDRIVAKCFQCKICYFKCPYTKRDHHEFDLDFPRLLLRYKAVRAKERGIPLIDRMLGNPDLLGKVGGVTAPLSNWSNRNPLARALMHGVVGIHRKKELPSFHRRTFYRWAKNHLREQTSRGESEEKVVLFYTCFGNYNKPELPQDTLFVLQKNGIEVAIPELNCCGMPAIESGNLEFAKRQARQNVQALFPYIKKGYKIVVLNPTCSLTMKEEYPLLLSDSFSAEDLVLFSRSVYDVSEYLFALKREDKLNRDFKTTPGRVAYHIPCHYRAQNIGYRSRDLLKSIAGTSFVLIDECCGHNGTWAMKRENFVDSLRIGEAAFSKIRNAAHDIIVSDCPLAAVQIRQALGEQVLHPMEVLARAYRPDGFAQRIES